MLHLRKELYALIIPRVIYDNNMLALKSYKLHLIVFLISVAVCVATSLLLEEV